MAMALIALCHVRSWDETHSERVIVWLFMIIPRLCYSHFYIT
jgi:hypothetical protein